MSNRGGSSIYGTECEYHQIGFSFDSTHDSYGPKNCVVQSKLSVSLVPSITSSIQKLQHSPVDESELNISLLFGECFSQPQVRIPLNKLSLIPYFLIL